MKFGQVRPQVGISDTWELVEEKEIGSLLTNTKLLLHMEGTDASTSILDSGETGHTVTANGTAQLDDAQKKFGSTSLLLDGNSDYLSIPDSTDWDFTTQTNNTIDFWIKFSSVATDQCIWSQYVDASNFVNFQYYQATDQLRFVVNSAATYIVDLNATSTINDTDWHHIAIVKVGSDYGMYLDGTQIAYDTTASTDTLAAALTIGAFNVGASDFVNGWMDELRLVNANPFSASPVVGLTDTITVPTAPYDGPTNQVTFSGLSGNTDEVYRLVARTVDSNTTNNIRMRFNNDSATNYGYQYLYGNSTSLTANRSSQTFIPVAFTNVDGYVSQGNILIYAKSGYVRTTLNELGIIINGTTVTGVQFRGHAWNNSADEITSIVISAEQDQMDTGSYLALYRKVA